MEERLFNPNSKFIKHKDKDRRTNPEIKAHNPEYLKEFRDFLVRVFREINFHPNNEIFDSLMSENYSNPSLSGSYLKGSYELMDAISGDLKQRINIDRYLSIEFYGENPTRAQVDEAFRQKIKLDVLLNCIKNEKDIAKKNILILIAQVIDRNAIPKTENEVEVVLGKPESLGACRVSERHILSYLSGKHVLQEMRGAGFKVGNINLILDDDDRPVMIEKVQLGENTCLSLRPIRIDGVLIPEGAIFGVESRSKIPKKGKESKKMMKWFEKSNRDGGINGITNLKDYLGFQYIRMSIISLPENLKAKAGGGNFQYLQEENESTGYTNYDWITTEVIFEYAKSRLEQVKRKIKTEDKK